MVKIRLPAEGPQSCVNSYGEEQLRFNSWSRSSSAACFTTGTVTHPERVKRVSAISSRIGPGGIRVSSDYARTIVWIRVVRASGHPEHGKDFSAGQPVAPSIFSAASLFAT